MSGRPWLLPRIGRPPSLRTRLSLVLTGLAACLLLSLGGLWLRETRGAVHEEIEAATRVAEQMLGLLTRGMRDEATLLALVGPLGRVRAHDLEVIDAGGTVRYRSPPPTYKAGRTAPAWFAALLAEEFPARTLVVGEHRLVLRPDSSRAVLDAWDDAVAIGGWAALGLVGLLLAVRTALARALRPLDHVMAALDRTGRGAFDTRLPAFASPELARLSRAFNGMADRLRAAVDDNVRLETEREVAARLQARLEAERADIARELHDELAQGITAVRALAGAIARRGAELPGAQVPARAIVAVTGEMQEGVRRILQRLQPAADPGGAALERLLADWRACHGDIALAARLGLGKTRLAPVLAHALLRIVQEGLTNVVRHAGASRVALDVACDGGVLTLRLADDGRGGATGPAAGAGCGFGLAAMAERVSLLGGELHTERPAGGGFVLSVRLPAILESCP